MWGSGKLNKRTILPSQTATLTPSPGPAPDGLPALIAARTADVGRNREKQRRRLVTRQHLHLHGSHGRIPVGLKVSLRLLEAWPPCAQCHLTRDDKGFRAPQTTASDNLEAPAAPGRKSPACTPSEE